VNDHARHTQALSTLYAISSTLNQSLEIREILQCALDGLVVAEGYDAGWVHLLPNEAGHAPLVVGRSASHQILERLAGRAASVATSGQPCVIDVDGTASVPEPSHDASDAIRALLLVPICVGERSLAPSAWPVAIDSASRRTSSSSSPRWAAK
jgi:nitrate/nitrite-specific signal transduction histidine kinase